ncbi:hypothetical protein ACFW04_003189 [Cataglyphis niger]
MSTKVPPDGGWGWIIVLASALNGISTIPIIQIFGLIYKDYFAKLNMNATDISIIINVNLAFGMMFGMINGALLKTFGYQKVAIAGSVMYTVGVMLTAFANTFTFFLICYGMLTSVGLGMSMSGFSLAINTYFTTRRNRAMALAVTITGLGPILMPQVASFLLAFYGIQQLHCRDESAASRYFRRIANLYDFDLLRDPTYINIMLGMSIAIFAEINFSMLTPFILADMGMTTTEIANIMSVIAIVDLVGRGISPYLGEWLRQPARMMYMLSLFLLIISRTALIFTKSFLSVLIVAMGLGLAKGIRSVYMTLVVPSYVPIHKLPSASGIQMLTNGVILTCAGPTLGLIRDNTGNYTICIILINFVTIITLFMWTIEILLVRRKSARRKSKLTEIS